ncbi:G-protein coupled receptor 26-like [Thalassophryne amazonica]|uniref:G-protein coupled receptor 26-like n=1 Tax=Thalassophryne amazonica TaxID=390379 RepID=UPI001472663F|nr:G-protein coupled receptor 26-like [Thalassophryne amazonica]
MHTAEIAASLLILGIIVVSLLSNGVVLICFLYNSSIRKQVPALFIVNLTLCNLLLSACNMPLTLVGLVTAGHPGGGGFCQTVGFLDTFLTTNSMLSMAALSIDRWVAVVFPLSYHSRIRHRDAVIALGYTWIHSLCFSTVATCRSWLGYHHLYASCTLCTARAKGAGAQFTVFTVALHSLSFLLTLIVMCVTYLKVLKVARSHCKRIDVITMQTLVLLVDIHPSIRQKCLDEQKRRRQRATKKISTFIGTFVVCFGPYVITRMLELFSPGPINPHWGVLSKCLAYSKAASDPFVYSLLRHQYRTTCSLLVNKVLKRSPFNSSSYWPENSIRRSNTNTGQTNKIQPTSKIQSKSSHEGMKKLDQTN